MNETTKEVYFPSGDFRENGKCEKTGTSARIHQRFGKTSVEVTKRGILTNGHYNKKMANLGEKGKFRQKWRVCQKFIKGLAKYSNERTKRGILANGDFTKMTNLEKSYLRFDKRGISIFVGCKKMVEIWENMFLEIADAHAPIRTRRGKKQKIPLDYH